MKLIDADALIKWLNDTYCDTSKRLWNYNHHVMAMDMIEIIKNYPTIEEHKHGHWIGKPIAGYSMVRCSVCSAFANNIERWNYCPICGAKMDEEIKE